MATFNDNELTALPPEIGNLTNLIELQVADNGNIVVFLHPYTLKT